MPSDIVEQVQAKYSEVAASDRSGQIAGVRGVALAFGYSPEELAAIPADANMGLSCGNPIAFAHLRPGETIVDLGCGGGLDVFLAAAKVGPSGRVIGIDMTPAMIERATRNAQKQGLANVEFHLAMIDRLPLPDASVDCLISNCVINLAPDKPAVFREMFRVLKPGGRVAVSDIALKKPLPQEIARDLMAYVGCIAGAVPFADYERGLRETGFAAAQIVDTRKDLNAYAQVADVESSCAPTAEGSCCGSDRRLVELMRKYNVNEYAASVQVYALKSN
jgi:SAM-dependent methyltransferase